MPSAAGDARDRSRGAVPGPAAANGGPSRGAKTGEPSIDPRLLDRAKRGDRRALEQLLEPELDRVYAVCLRMLGNPERARDLSQESLVKVIRGLSGFDGRSSLSTWVTRVTTNACLSWLRAEKYRRTVSLSGSPGSAGEEAGETGPEIGLAGELPGDPGVQMEEDGALVAALDRLTPEHRAVLVLRDVRDLSYEQIGLVLDVAPGTVRSRLFRARAALRRELEVEDSVETTESSGADG